MGKLPQRAPSTTQTDCGTAQREAEMIGFLRPLCLAILLGLVTSVSASAAAWSGYDAQRFRAAQDAGRSIIVDVYADWCPVCRRQKPILDDIARLPALKDAMLVRVDFDTQKEFLRTHRIPRQSTILVFKGRKETARSIAETDPAKLREVVLNGLQ
jgi:thioredoxin 1